MKGTSKELAAKCNMTNPEMSMIISILKKKNPNSVKVVGLGPKPKRGRQAKIYEISPDISFKLN